ncbi:hypothetical protein LXL04_002188 [Taraxacum kok-saghyz]
MKNEAFEMHKFSFNCFWFYTSKNHTPAKQWKSYRLGEAFGERRWRRLPLRSPAPSWTPAVNSNKMVAAVVCRSTPTSLSKSHQFFMVPFIFHKLKSKYIMRNVTQISKSSLRQLGHENAKILNAKGELRSTGSDNINDHAKGKSGNEEG